jgi:hypothetical protein
MAISKLNPIEGGIPFGNTADRPADPVIGTVYYNGELEILEIYNGTGWVANSAPPATPTIATPTDVGTVDYTAGGSLSVVFTPGSGGGTPSQYNAFTTAGGFSASNSSTTVTLTGLTPATSFTVYGNAQNNFGTTVNTGNSTAVTATTKPQAPTIGTATASGSANEVTVTWTNGATGGKALSAITITPYLNGTTAETTRTAATTSSTSYKFTVGQLTAGSNYTFKVKATNENGISPESSASNSATMPNFLNVDYLVVAGGGGGGYEDAGGGGAGGLRSTVTASGGSPGTVESLLAVQLSTNYTVTVGAGGAGGLFNTVIASQGSNSVFSTITSNGGGRAGSEASGAPSTMDGATGGSGGGGAGSNTGIPGVGGSGTANQGYAGGAGFIRTAGNEGGGGGGGAGQAGSAAITSRGGNGGNGVTVSITGSSVTYAGGGGGGQQGTTPGTGGTGGGGAGGSSTNVDGTAGTVNTGGGGGGGGGNSGNADGGAGGSGIVVLRYEDTKTITIGAGLTGSTSAASGGYKRTTLTAGTGNVSWS